jgi:hypothetical protein
MINSIMYCGNAYAQSTPPEVYFACQPTAYRCGCTEYTHTPLSHSVPVMVYRLRRTGRQCSPPYRCGFTEYTHTPLSQSVPVMLYRLRRTGRQCTVTLPHAVPAVIYRLYTDVIQEGNARSALTSTTAVAAAPIATPVPAARAPPRETPHTPIAVCILQGWVVIYSHHTGTVCISQGGVTIHTRPVLAACGPPLQRQLSEISSSTRTLITVCFVWWLGDECRGVVHVAGSDALN